MVKNVKGGNKGKGMARKHVVNNGATTFLRVAVDEAEIYAIIIKLLGNGMFHCHGIDNVLRLGHIRGKFAGRGKRDNTIEMGTWVLIGAREWEEKSSIVKKTNKLPQCDLLEVYLSQDKDRLRDTLNLNWHILQKHDQSSTDDTNDNSDDIFMTEKDEERHKLIDEMNLNTSIKVQLTTTTSLKNNIGIIEEEINIDDI